MPFLKHLALAAILAAPLTASALAGPFGDAEARIRLAYADYRAALFQTNQKDKAATMASLAGFRAKWAALAADWRALPPPQYADDAELPGTLESVARTAEAAEAAASAGDLAKSHEILEAIRDQLGRLRSRNGVVSFSDRMNAYHEVMEHAYDMTEMTPAAALEHAAVLAYLAKDIASNRPAGVDAAAFDTALKALEASADAFRTAARSGDRAAIDTARKALKAPYSRMFLRFG